jgi:hypothetical protein
MTAKNMNFPLELLKDYHIRISLPIDLNNLFKLCSQVQAIRFCQLKTKFDRFPFFSGDFKISHHN